MANSNGVQSRTRMVSAARTLTKTQSKMWSKKELLAAQRQKARLDNYLHNRVSAYIAAREYDVCISQCYYSIIDHNNIEVRTHHNHYSSSPPPANQPEKFIIPNRYLTDAEFSFKVSMGFFSEQELTEMTATKDEK